MAKIGIDAKLVDGRSGGVQQFIIGLAQGLSKLTSTDDEYIFFVYRDQAAWLEPYVAGHCRLYPVGDAPKSPTWKRTLKELPYLRRMWHWIQSKRKHQFVTRSDGFIEQLGVDLMHFTTQRAFLTDVPTIYHPWDLQHLHLPQFFSSYEHQQREATYQVFCEQAQMVAVASTWIKQDVIQHYHLSPEKVQVIPMASVLSDYPKPTPTELAQMRAKLPQRFIYYPAQTWQHKNHLKLLDALVLLRDEYGLNIPLVLSGTMNTYGRVIQKYIQKHRLNNQVVLLGYVSVVEVQALYQLCDMLVFPSRFEGWGLPITEAMASGVPIACSNATHLPQLVADAGLVFDPDQADEIATAIYQIWTDDTLRHNLRQKALARSRLFSWEYTASLFHAHYQRILGNTLTPQMQALLAREPLV